ncbi:MAG: hypothetical protein BWX88_00431 [Planctomycetes bacterium ADurb.Bin126]|nr:MAG: hypothetical protein BWX88_00431 [Planctomycetes bacterium ADurb.Bin126]HOD80180.1 Na-translocating system protein MpsC family protein [Phycisphaerae bacterium]HQL71652.1 Na-translocating system protein MpsC family protein [Phycisphaerae bacterium]
MTKPRSSIAQRIAQAVMACQTHTTGHAPKGVTVSLSGDALVVTLHDALSPAEKDLARTPEGAAQVREFQRQLFAVSSPSLREEIRRITGVEVREAVAEVEASPGAVVCALASGAIVQVFQFAPGTLTDTWGESGLTDQEEQGRSR